MNLELRIGNGNFEYMQPTICYTLNAMDGAFDSFRTVKNNVFVNRFFWFSIKTSARAINKQYLTKASNISFSK
jgi:hypothetical protein